MANYSIWLLEYGHILNQSASVVFAGLHNEGLRMMPFSYLLVQGEGHTILVDVGMNPGQDESARRLAERDDVTDWQPPEHVLSKVGVRPEDVDAVLLTHAHYDHIGNLLAFPRAHFYLQKRELEEWSWAVTLPPRFRTMLVATNPEDLGIAQRLVDEGRMILVEGEQDNIFPGIHLRPSYNSHTFASQMVVIELQDDTTPWLYCGDLAYSRANLTGLEGDGVYVPVGLAVGSQYNLLKSYDAMLALVGGRLDHVIIGHETDSWQLYPSWETSDHLHVSEVHLAPGQASMRP